MSKFASLTAGLLARKGEAEPSATPFADQLLTRVGAAAVDMRPMIQNAPQRPQPAHFSPPVFGRRPTHDHDHPHQQLRDEGEVPPAVAPLTTPVELPAAMVPAVVPVAVPQLVHSMDEDHHEIAANESRCGACPGPSAEEANKTYHVNLRMKRMRFVRLKLTSALMRKPVQEIVNEALDAWFETVPHDVLGDCACLNARSD